MDLLTRIKKPVIILSTATMLSFIALPFSTAAAESRTTPKVFINEGKDLVTDEQIKELRKEFEEKYTDENQGFR
ncbi:hypothetical protein HRF87_02765 [Bacillus sp. CRN 9]|nr:hypothetical protein [Bacillus sp. CRN 9]